MLQFVQPVAQVYEHAVPAGHVAPVVCCEPHATPHPPQFVAVVVGVSQPLAFGAVELQSS
jgi:hypothetical protein